MSTLKVNSIIPVAGVPTGGGGGIIQIKQAIKTDKFATSSTSYTDITGISVTITPQSSSNKILVFTNVRFGSGNSNLDNYYQILRGSTVISADNSMRQPSFSANWIYADMNLDSPNTTSAITYKVQCKAESNEVFVNRDNSNRDFGMSYITVMEVSA